MADFIIAGMILMIIGAAIFYMIKAKKSGVRCIGCPACGKCSGKKEGHACRDCGGYNDTNGS